MLLCLEKPYLASFAVFARAVPCNAAVRPNVAGLQAGAFNSSPPSKGINSNPEASEGVAQKPLI